jgi:hypothetical protein
VSTPTPQNPSEIELSLAHARKQLEALRERERLLAADVLTLERRLAYARVAWSARSAVAES